MLASQTHVLSRNKIYGFTLLILTVPQILTKLIETYQAVRFDFTRHKQLLVFIQLIKAETFT